MSKPEINEVVGGFEFSWGEERLVIKVSRLRVHTSDGRVTGELLIKNIDGKTLYPQTSFNFTSERTRTILSKTLMELDSHWQWSDIINQMSVSIINKAREGEPVKELWTDDDVEPPELLLDPILYKGLPTIIFGEKTSCKSTLSLAAYACLILPWYDNPLGWVAPTRSVKALIADYEVDPNIAQYNAKQLQQGMGLPPFPLYYRRCFLPIADDVEQLQRRMSDIGAEVLIVDSLGPAVGGDLKDPAEALRFTAAIRQLHCSALIIGQTSKEREGKGRVKSTFGSVYFEYYARNIFELKKVQEEGENSLDLAMYNTYHNLGRRCRAQGFRLEFNGTGTHIESSPITARELVAKIGAQVRILDLLKEGPKTTGDIMETLDISRSNADTSLSRLKNQKKVIKLEDKWGLLQQDPFI